MELGPLEENGATTGAGDLPITVLLGNILTTESLSQSTKLILINRFCINNAEN